VKALQHKYVTSFWVLFWDLVFKEMKNIKAKVIIIDYGKAIRQFTYMI
jgi:hypothetical protein